MKTLLLTIGKGHQKELTPVISEYQNRLGNYAQFDACNIPALKNTRNLSVNEVCDKESLMLLKHIRETDYLVLLDEKGNSFSSIKFAKRIQSWMLLGRKRLVFVIGGAYGFSENLYNRSNELLSLSKMTFTHQMVRLFFLEQLYRGYTILNNEPYHHS